MEQQRTLFRFDLDARCSLYAKAGWIFVVPRVNRFGHAAITRAGRGRLTVVSGCWRSGEIPSRHWPPPRAKPCN